MATAETTVVEHATLRVSVDGARGTFAVTDKSCGVEWAPDPWDRSAGELVVEERSAGARIVCDLSRARTVSVERIGDGVRITFDGLCGARGAEAVGGRVVTRLELVAGAPELLVTLEEVSLDEARFALVAVQYPLRFGALKTLVEPGALVLPYWQGTLVPTGHVALPAVDFWEFEDRAWQDGWHEIAFPSMPWYGAQREGSHAWRARGGYVCIAETPDDVSLLTVANFNRQRDYDVRGEESPLPRIAAASPNWLASLGALGYRRRARYVFGPGMDYVAMAKRYRRHARQVGELTTLAEKAAARPAVRRLAGAPWIALYAGYPHFAPATAYPPYAYRYTDVTRIVRDLHQTLGLPTALVNLWGAFAAQPPRAVPFDRSPGPLEDLREAVRTAHGLGYLFALYNDVTALLEGSGFWDGGLIAWPEPGHYQVSGRWLRTCSSEYVSLISRFMPEVVRELGLLASYVDCVHVRWRECYAPHHPHSPAQPSSPNAPRGQGGHPPLTRAQDRANRVELGRYLHSLGLVFGGEHLQSYAAPEVDYCNGMSIPLTSIPLSAPAFLRMFPVPLWQLVFHDSVVAYCHSIDDYTATRGTDFADKLLRDALYGAPPLYFLNLHDYPKWRARIGLANKAIGELLRRVAFDEMESHAFLTADQDAQRTRFSSGVEVTVNFGLEARDDGSGAPLPPKSFRVVGLNRTPSTGSFALTYRAGT
jgi:hypothetical protein